MGKIKFGKKSQISFINGLEVVGDEKSINLPQKVLELADTSADLTEQVKEVNSTSGVFGNYTKKMSQLNQKTIKSTIDGFTALVENIKTQLVVVEQGQEDSYQAANQGVIGILAAIGNGIISGDPVGAIVDVCTGAYKTIESCGDADVYKQCAKEMLQQVEKLGISISEMWKEYRAFNKLEENLALEIEDVEKRDEEIARIQKEFNDLAKEIEDSLEPVKDPLDPKTFIERNPVVNWTLTARDGEFNVNGNKVIFDKNGVLGSQFVQHQDVSMFQTASDVNTIITSKDFTTLGGVRTALGIDSGTIDDKINSKDFITPSIFDSTYRSQVTPRIGDNGNWWIGTTDTQRPSRGEKGEVDAEELKSAVTGEIDKRQLITESILDGKGFTTLSAVQSLGYKTENDINTIIDAKGFSKITAADVANQISDNAEIKKIAGMESNISSLETTTAGVKAKTDLFSISDDVITVSKTFNLGNTMRMGTTTLTVTDIDNAKAAGVNAAEALSTANSAKVITDKLDNGVVEKVKNAATLSSIRHNDIY